MFLRNDLAFLNQIVDVINFLGVSDLNKAVDKCQHRFGVLFLNNL